MTPHIVSSFLSIINNSPRFNTQNLISESLSIFRVFIQSSYTVLVQRPQDWLPRTIYSLVDSNVQVRQKALLVVQECLKRPRDNRIPKTIVQVFRKPLDNGDASSVMLIDMFEMAFEDFFKTPDDARAAAPLWSTLLRLMQSWGPGPTEHFEAWEYYNNWITIAKTVFEKGSPIAQTYMLQAWRDYIYISAELPLSLETAKLVTVNQVATKSIVTLTRPLRLLLSPNDAVYEQAEDCCFRILYSCLNPLFTTNTAAELDVFWTDVVENCIRQFLKDGPHAERRRLRILDILSLLFKPQQSPQSPLSNSRWVSSKILDEKFDPGDIPGLPSKWVRAKSHIIVANLLNVVFPKVNLDSDPWAEVWYNFATLSCQQMYREQVTPLGDLHKSEDSYNVLRTIMNGTVQLLEQQKQGSDVINELLSFLVKLCEPILSHLLQDKMGFSVSPNGPYIVRCASPALASLPVATDSAADTFDVNPVILLWTIVMKFTQKLDHSNSMSLHNFAYMKLLKLLLPSNSHTEETQQLLADLTTVLVNTVYNPDFDIDPLWTYISQHSGIDISDTNQTLTGELDLVTVNNMIRLHILFLKSSPNPTKDCSFESNEVAVSQASISTSVTTLPIHIWSRYLAIYTNTLLTRGMAEFYMQDVIGVYCKDITKSSAGFPNMHAGILYHFMIHLLNVSKAKPLWETLKPSTSNDALKTSASWNPFFNMVIDLMKSLNSAEPHPDSNALFLSIFTFMSALLTHTRSLRMLSVELIQGFVGLAKLLDLTSKPVQEKGVQTYMAYFSMFECIGPRQIVTSTKQKRHSPRSSAKPLIEFEYSWSAQDEAFVQSCLELKSDPPVSWNQMKSQDKVLLELVVALEARLVFDFYLERHLKSAMPAKLIPEGSLLSDEQRKIAVSNRALYHMPVPKLLKKVPMGKNASVRVTIEELKKSELSEGTGVTDTSKADQDTEMAEAETQAITPTRPTKQTMTVIYVSPSVSPEERRKTLSELGSESLSSINNTYDSEKTESSEQNVPNLTVLEADDDAPIEVDGVNASQSLKANETKVDEQHSRRSGRLRAARLSSKYGIGNSTNVGKRGGRSSLQESSPAIVSTKKQLSLPAPTSNTSEVAVSKSRTAGLKRTASRSSLTSDRVLRSLQHAPTLSPLSTNAKKTKSLPHSHVTDVGEFLPSRRTRSGRGMGHPMVVNAFSSASEREDNEDIKQARKSETSTGKENENQQVDLIQVPTTPTSSSTLELTSNNSLTGSKSGKKKVVRRRGRKRKYSTQNKEDDMVVSIMDDREDEYDESGPDTTGSENMSIDTKPNKDTDTKSIIEVEVPVPPQETHEIASKNENDDLAKIIPMIQDEEESVEIITKCKPEEDLEEHHVSKKLRISYSDTIIKATPRVSTVSSISTSISAPPTPEKDDMDSMHPGLLYKTTFTQTEKLSSDPDSVYPHFTPTSHNGSNTLLSSVCPPVPTHTPTDNLLSALSTYLSETQSQLEASSSSATTATTTTKVTADKNQIFELETQLMQALMQTRRLVMDEQEKERRN